MQHGRARFPRSPGTFLRPNPWIELPNPTMTASGERKSVRCTWGMPNCARWGSEPRFREVSSLLQVFSRLLSCTAVSSIRAVSSCTGNTWKKPILLLFNHKKGGKLHILKIASESNVISWIFLKRCRELRMNIINVKLKM